MAFSQVEVPKGTWIYVSSDLSTNANNVQISPGRPLLLLQANIVPGVHFIIHDSTFKHYYVKKSDVVVTPLITEADCPETECPPAPEPNCPEPTADDCKLFSDAAYAQGKTDGFAAGTVAGTTAGIIKGVGQEQTRMKNLLGLK